MCRCTQKKLHASAEPTDGACHRRCRTDSGLSGCSDSVRRSGRAVFSEAGGARALPAQPPTNQRDLLGPGGAGRADGGDHAAHAAAETPGAQPHDAPGQRHPGKAGDAAGSRVRGWRGSSAGSVTGHRPDQS